MHDHIKQYHIPIKIWSHMHILNIDHDLVSNPCLEMSLIMRLANDYA